MSIGLLVLPLVILWGLVRILPPWLEGDGAPSSTPGNAL
jgi:hypothetical protein